MGENNPEKEILLDKIKRKRKEVTDYLDRNEPRHSRLIMSSIICAALAAALTAGPGVGGSGFINAAKGIVSFGIPVWQVLCLAATFFSVTAVIANSILKTNDLASKIAAVRSCDAKLEGLQTMLELEQVTLAQATPLYTQYLTEIPHV